MEGKLAQSHAAGRCLYCSFAQVACLHPFRLAFLRASSRVHSKQHHLHGGADRQEVTSAEGEEGDGDDDATQQLLRKEGVPSANPNASLQASENAEDRKQEGKLSASPSSSSRGVGATPHSLQVSGNPISSNGISAIPESSQLPMYPGDEGFTYSELLALVNALARRLRETTSHPLDHDSPCFAVEAAMDKEVFEPVKRVGIFISPSVEYVVAVLAVLECGFAFVPLEPFWPAQRVAEVVADSKPCLLLTCQQPWEADLAAISCSVKVPILHLDPAFTKVFEHSTTGGDAECLCFCHTKQERPYCYLMYTSGSTGKPKGVCGTEMGLLHRLQWMQSEYPFVASDVAVFKTSIAFIDHLTELFGPLLGNSPIVVPPPGDLFRNPLALLPFLQAYNVSRLTAVPSLMRALLPVLQTPAGHRVLMSVRVLVLSGEILSHQLLESIRDLLPHAFILNLYGSTELSGDCLFFDCGASGKEWDHPSVPIGKPLPGCSIQILSDSSQMVDEGELWVGGVLLALGYHNDTLSTSQKFMSIPIPPDAGNGNIIFFRTGDYVKKLKNGNLLYLGRKDRTVKVNGHKVAPEEIESNLEMHPLVARAVVSLQLGVNSDHSIVAYVILKLQKETSTSNDVEEISETSAKAGSNGISEIEASLRSWLIERLPSAMIPNRFSFLTALPMVSSGKVDYQALSMSIVSGSDMAYGDSLEAEVSSLSIRIKEAFQRVLKLDSISVYDDFFCLGGTSVSAAHVAHILGIDMQILYIHSSAIALEPILKAQLEEAILSSASKLDEDLPDSRKYKRVKGDESVGMSNLVPCSLSNDKNGPNSRHTNMGLYSDWPCVQIAEPMALLRCNTHAPSKLSSHNIVNRMAYNVFLYSASINGLCDMMVLWRTRLKACIDASPALVQSRSRWHLFIGSHAHNFVCIDAYSGNLIWESVLGGRVESTAAITSDFSQVVVGSYDGFLYFMEYETGILKWKFQTKAEVKCQPTVDVQEGLIWCGSHDHNLYVLNAVDQKCVWKHNCKASVFAAPAHDSTRKLTYVATTGGTVTAITTDGSHPRVSWTHACGTPIFGSPIIDHALGYVICTLVNGCVLAFTPSGSLAWKFSTLGPVFAGATLTSALPSQVLICSRDGWVYSLNLSDGMCLWKHYLGEPITSAAFVDEGLHLVFREYKDCNVYLHSFRLVCACGSSGQVHILKVYAGSTMSGVTTAPSTSAAVENCSGHEESPEEERFIGQGVTDKEKKKDGNLMVGENSNHWGAVSAQEHGYCAAYKGCELIAVLRLPGDIFSSPVMLGGRIFVGCRDNNLYCLKITGLDV